MSVSPMTQVGLWRSVSGNQLLEWNIDVSVGKVQMNMQAGYGLEMVVTTIILYHKPQHQKMKLQTLKSLLQNVALIEVEM